MKTAICAFLDGYLQKTAVVSEALTREKVKSLETQQQMPAEAPKTKQGGMDLQTKQQQLVAQNPAVPATF